MTDINVNKTENDFLQDMSLFLRVKAIRSIEFMS